MDLTTFINNTIKYMGDNKFYSYSSFSNNCQNFCDSLLSANHINSPEARKFLFQDKVPEIGKELHPNTVNVMNRITDLGSIVSRLRGKGALNKTVNKFVDVYMKDKNINDKSMIDHFIDFYNDELL